MAPALTPRQQEILEMIRSELARGSGFPSLNTIAAKVGIKTKRGVAIHLDALERKGYVNRQTQYFELTDQHAFPFASGLAAGSPKEAFDSNELIRFDPAYFGKGRLVAMKVAGESMSGDAIHDGDIVIIDLAADGGEARKKGIVALCVDGSETTLKRLRVQGELVELLPSNPDYSVLRYQAERVEVLGAYVGLVRKI